MIPEGVNWKLAHAWHGPFVVKKLMNGGGWYVLLNAKKQSSIMPNYTIANLLNGKHMKRTMNAFLEDSAETIESHIEDNIPIEDELFFNHFVWKTAEPTVRSIVRIRQKQPKSRHTEYFEIFEIPRKEHTTILCPGEHFIFWGGCIQWFDR